MTKIQNPKLDESEKKLTYVIPAFAGIQSFD